MPSSARLILNAPLSGRGDVILCAAGMDALDLSESEFVEGARRGTFAELAAATSQMVLVF